MATNRLRRLIAIVILQCLAGWAHACMFARDAKPQDWYQWASALFAADVTNVEQDRGKALDIITTRVVETFKGPKGATATVEVPQRMWSACRLELPAVGAHVLVALNANGDALLIPLTESYAELLRRLRPPQGAAD